MSFEELFSVEREDGWLVAFSLPEVHSDVTWGEDCDLSSEEKTFASSLERRRAISFVGGRLALRVALTKLGAPLYDSLPNPRGAPNVPAGYRASISHKDEVAIAYAEVDSGWYVGVDLEVSTPDRSRIARKVLTDDELRVVDTLQGAERWKAILRRFSIKEAVYKAIDPMVQRYVGFKEVAVTFDEGSHVFIDLRLKTLESVEVRCEQFERDDLIISTVGARLTRPV